MICKRVQLDLQQSLASAPIKFRDVNVRTTLELDPEKRPLEQGPDHLHRCDEIRWVDTGLRVSVSMSSPSGATVVPTTIASFTIGTSLVLNQEKFKNSKTVHFRLFLKWCVTPKDARPCRGGVVPVALLHDQFESRKR